MDGNSSGMKAFNACAVLMWIAKLNLAWLLFTALGGVLFGIGPSTVAAFDSVRRYQDGGIVAIGAHFRSTFRREFGRANLLTLPIVVAAAGLWWNWQQLTGRSVLVWLPLGLVAALFTGSVCVLFPMYSRYELPLRSYYVTASRFALRFLPFTALLVFVTAAAYFVTSFVPVLALCFSAGAWIYVDSYLCAKFFSYNEALLADDQAPVAGVSPQIPSRG